MTLQIFCSSNVSKFIILLFSYMKCFTSKMKNVKLASFKMTLKCNLKGIGWNNVIQNFIWLSFLCWLTLFSLYYFNTTKEHSSCWIKQFQVHTHQIQYKNTYYTKCYWDTRGIREVRLWKFKIYCLKIRCL